MMEARKPTQEEAFGLLKEYDRSEPLIRHASAVKPVKKKWKEARLIRSMAKN